MEYSKNMENKYFIPTKEDIRIGYECEIDFAQKVKGDNWQPYTIGEGYEDVSLNRVVQEARYDHDPFFQESRIRVPYLTREQIEADGGVFIGGYTPMLSRRSEYDLGKYHRLEYSEETKKATIYSRDEFGEFTAHGVKYSGFIPSINELRYISKLLEIK
jgi:hypothetical protein